MCTHRPRLAQAPDRLCSGRQGGNARVLGTDPLPTTGDPAPTPTNVRATLAFPGKGVEAASPLGMPRATSPVHVHGLRVQPPAPCPTEARELTPAVRDSASFPTHVALTRVPARWAATSPWGAASGALAPSQLSLWRLLRYQLGHSYLLRTHVDGLFLHPFTCKIPILPPKGDCEDPSMVSTRQRRPGPRWAMAALLAKQGPRSLRGGGDEAPR